MSRTPRRPNLPDPAEVPDWSDKTLALLEALSPAERCFVEWYSTGLNAAEAYRKAVGRPPGQAGDTSPQLGYKLKGRARIRVAIAAALGDRDVGARMDREFLLQKLYLAIHRIEELDTSRAWLGIAKIVTLIAKLQGDYPHRGRPAHPDEGLGTREAVQKRVQDFIDKVVGTGRTPAGGPGQAVPAPETAMQRFERAVADAGHGRPVSDGSELRPVEPVVHVVHVVPQEAVVRPGGQLVPTLAAERPAAVDHPPPGPPTGKGWRFMPPRG